MPKKSQDAFLEFLKKKRKEVSRQQSREAFMDNGQVYFRKTENAGGDYPLLRDVHYIGRQTSPDGKEVKNILNQAWQRVALAGVHVHQQTAHHVDRAGCGQFSCGTAH